MSFSVCAIDIVAVSSHNAVNSDINAAAAAGV